MMEDDSEITPLPSSPNWFAMMLFLITANEPAAQ
jgi:hypothetical protein